MEVGGGVGEGSGFVVGACDGFWGMVGFSNDFLGGKLLEMWLGRITSAGLLHIFQNHLRKINGWE